MGRTSWVALFVSAWVGLRGLLRVSPHGSLRVSAWVAPRVRMGRSACPHVVDFFALVLCRNMYSEDSGGSNAFDELTPYHQRKIVNISGKNHDTRSNLKKKKPRHEKQLQPSPEVIVISSDSSCHNRYVSLLR